MKQITMGILAHVDAGKTTLSEAMLYTAGEIRSPGRVDHGNSFLDTQSQERARGITIFSKQAEIHYRDTRFMLLDTPGHVDFSAEMERTLPVLDYAVLVISGRDGVQGHTVTLHRLLERYGIPTFIFVNKMDLEGTDRDAILGELRRALGDGCLVFNEGQPEAEELALCDESLLSEYLENGKISDACVRSSIRRRRVFPCYFGSGLRLEGVKELMDGLDRWTEQGDYPGDFSARVYKISRDAQGNRLTHMKITGGRLRVRDGLETGEGEEKAAQLRIYSGDKFRTAEEVAAGSVCAVCGLENTFAGQGLGSEAKNNRSLLEPALVYRVMLPEGEDVYGAFLRLKQLEEEEPQLNIEWHDKLQEIRVQLMGEVQLEILQQLIYDRFGLEVSFGEGRIAYRETISEPVMGAGHFEPLRHYAEVHLLLEPLEAGSGLVFDTACSEDELDRNWQRLILTHLMERSHPGALTGSPVTDMKITLLAGRAHKKHTEGGDFRQATYRALRQGLRKARGVLLEPWYDFVLEVPQDALGRAMADIQRMGGSFEPPESTGDTAVLRGRAPISEMRSYTAQVQSYTKGYGHLSCTMSGYAPCHEAAAVIAAIGYDADNDVDNPADSIFCEHGAGFSVPWDQADEHMHVRPGISLGTEASTDDEPLSSENDNTGEIQDASHDKRARVLRERERMPAHTIEGEKVYRRTKPAEIRTEHLLVDGYNIIFAWDELKELAAVDMGAAREALIGILSNYQGYRRCMVTVVFDAYRVKDGRRRSEKSGNISVVFTGEGETADTYIEKMTYDMAGKYQVRVATSDRQEQIIASGNGAFRLSAAELKAEIERTDAEISEILKELGRKNAREHRNGINI